MFWLKVYQWELDTWPEFTKVHIDRTRQRALLRKLARHFKVDEPYIGQSRQRGANVSSGGIGAGHYHRGSWSSGPHIDMGTITTLRVLCHEFAHHLDWRRHGGHGHRRTFKRELRRVYTWSKRYLPKEGA